MSHEYDAYGNMIEGRFASAIQLGYNEKKMDLMTGWYDYGFRDYSPMMMRFNTVDPIKDGVNWYVFVGGDPVNYTDQFGLSGGKEDVVESYTPPLSPEEQFFNDVSLNEAMDLVRTSDFAKTERGAEILDLLEDAQNCGRILLDPTLDEDGGCWDSANRIYVHPKALMDPQRIAAIIIHEGTHMLRDLLEEDEGFPNEREAFDNMNAFQKEFDPDAPNATDQEILDSYGFLNKEGIPDDDGPNDWDRRCPNEAN